MTSTNRYQPGTGEGLGSTPDLNERRRLAEAPKPGVEQMEIIDTDHHEIGTRPVPDLPLPDPQAARQNYPSAGRQPKSDAYTFDGALWCAKNC